MERVSRLLAYCNDNRIGVIRTGNTSYCGGATPNEYWQHLRLVCLVGSHAAHTCKSLDVPRTRLMPSDLYVLT